jgi:hypothetical protein
MVKRKKLGKNQGRVDMEKSREPKRKRLDSIINKTMASSILIPILLYNPVRMLMKKKPKENASIKKLDFSN